MSRKALWYDSFYQEKTIEKTYPWYVGLEKILSIKKICLNKTRILEVGCGAGEFLNSLSVSPSFGVDISTSALRIACKNAQHPHVACAQAEHLPFQDSFFDYIICCEVLEHVDIPEKVLQEIFRITKPEGGLFFSFPNYYNPFYTLLRLLATIFKKPKWVSLQITDRFLWYNKVISMLKKTGFMLVMAKGTCYFHTKIPVMKKLNRFSDILDARKMQWASFHPVLFLQKTSTHQLEKKVQ
jgi:2-polyprenyl-3-methyl-5-hydroxy-6-metoxy-1,4-benzoquinol methylase